jgi:hypothetical protein
VRDHSNDGHVHRILRTKSSKAAAGRPAEPAAVFHIERLAFHGAIGAARLPETPQITKFVYLDEHEQEMERTWRIKLTIHNAFGIARLP